MGKAIGQLKSKVKVYCTICGCSHTRNLTVNIFNNNAEEIATAKLQILENSKKDYTCRICKSILNSK